MFPKLRNLFLLVLLIASPLGAQLTESALSAFRKDARVAARDQYALLAAAVTKDRREYQALLDAASRAVESLDAGMRAMMESTPLTRRSRKAELAAIAVSVRSTLSPHGAFPPPQAASFSRLLGKSVLATSKPSALASLETAIISLCPPPRKAYLESLGSLFRSGGIKTSIAWLQALSSSLCLDPAPLEALARDTASSLNAAEEARSLLASLQAATEIESDFRTRPLAWVCPPLASEEAPSLPLYGPRDSGLALALADPGPWYNALDTRLSSLARELSTFLCLLPRSALDSRFGGMRPAPWRNVVAATEQDRAQAGLLLARFEASLPVRKAGEPEVMPLTLEDDSLSAFAAIAASPAALDLLTTEGWARERGVLQAWIASLFSSQGRDGRLLLSPSGALISLKGGSLPEALEGLRLFLATEGSFLGKDGTIPSTPGDSRALLWRWALLRGAFTGEEA